jgi:hypothetical protein
LTYSPDGFLKVTLVSKNDLPIGIYAPDGSIRVTTDPGLGLYAPNGAWRVSDENSSSTYTTDGNLNGYVVAGVLYTPDKGVWASAYASYPAPNGYRWEFVTSFDERVTSFGVPVVSLVEN